MSETIFDTWDGDDSTLEGDMARILDKYGVSVEGLSGTETVLFLSGTLGALQEAKGSTSEFSTTMFILYKELEIGKSPQHRRRNTRSTTQS